MMTKSAAGMEAVELLSARSKLINELNLVNCFFFRKLIWLKCGVEAVVALLRLLCCAVGSRSAWDQY